MKTRYTSITLLLVVFFIQVYAQETKQIAIETKNTSLLLTVNSTGKIFQSYFGEKLNDQDGYKQLKPSRHEAYIPSGMENLFEPAIRVIHHDGNPSLVLKYTDHKTEKKDNMVITEIHLKDPVYPVEVVLYYTAYYNENVITTRTEIKHTESKPVVLTNFASSMLHFDAPSYWLTQFHGNHNAEMKMQESQLTSGIKIIDSKLGARANMYQSPVFFLSLNKPSDENTGELIAGTLAWTGNFQFLFEVDEQNSLRLIS
ncbi:MAG TPA: glycoside hydrolase family 36 N-terminal domain-containing protein, partial [Sphingobacteriaceae bacterium]